MEPFECDGLWWLPGDSERQVAGNLQFSPEEGLRLALVGTLGEAPAGPEPQKYPIVLGLVQDCKLGNAVTLTGCYRSSYSIGMPGFAREKVQASRGFIGAQLETEDSFRFQSFSLEYSGLSSWADVSGFERPKWDHRSGKVRLEIAYNSPAKLEAKVDGRKAVLSFGISLSSTSREQVLREIVILIVNGGEPLCPDEINDRYVYPFQNFLTLATDHPNALTKFTLHLGPLVEGNTIHLLGARVYNKREPAEGLHPHEMLFTLKDIRQRFSETLNNWLAQANGQLREVCNVFFGMLYRPESYLDTKFLTVVQSLMLYHDARYEAQRRGQAAGQQRLGTRVRLRECLRRLADPHQAVLAPLVGNDLDRFVSEVVSTRNYLVHREPTLKDTAAHDGRLYWLTQKLMWLMKACFLTELGITEEEQLRLFDRNQYYMYIRSLKPEDVRVRMEEAPPSRGGI